MGEKMGWPTKVACLGLVGGIIWCLVGLSRGNLTPRETILFTSALTVLSIAVSWFTSKHYSEQSYTKALKVFGRKAAEKVNNLSNELNKLTAFLQQELDPNSDVSAAEALSLTHMRMEAAIHMLGTLRSINEGSLSDWQTVIGDEIDQQKERQEEKEETLRDIMEMMKALPEAASGNERPEAEPVSSQNLDKEIKSIRNEMRVLATQISGVPIRDTGPKKRREHVQNKCPKCGQPVTYNQKTKAHSMKPVSCPHCGVSLVSRESGGSFVLTERIPVMEKVECPRCCVVNSFQLDPLVASSTEFECNNCHAHVRASRRSTSIRLRLLDKTSGTQSNSQISEELLKRIREAMGKQPWPHGRAREVATQLNVSAAVVSQALQILIRRGDFLVQVDGKLYAPIDGAQGA